MKKYIYSTLLSVLVLGGMSSCQDKTEDRVFDETVSDRLNQQEQKLKDLLYDSEYGWKFVYYPDVESFGGFTFLVEFKGDREARMVTDFNADGVKIEVGEFQIQQRITTSLVFTTRNKIHLLSDPIDSPYGGGTAFDGEYQFGYYGNTADEIYFETPKRGQKVVFVKATKEDWDNLNKHLEMSAHMNRADASNFRVLEVGSGSSKESYDVNFAGAVRLLGFSGEKVNGNETLAVAYTDKGIKLTPGIDVEGKTVSELIYNDTSQAFISEDQQVKLSFESDPVNWKDETFSKLVGLASNRSNIRLLFDTSLEGTILPSSFSSSFLVSEVNKLGKDVKGEYNLSMILFQFNVNYGGARVAVANYTYKNKPYQFLFIASDGGNKLKITPAFWLQDSVPQEIEAFNEYLLGGDVYIRYEKSKYKYSNPVISIISTNSAMVLPTWDFDVVL